MDVRLILDAPLPGSANMAVDEALLDSASRGETILRFYRWQPATLSLGYFQAYQDRRLHAASSELDVVRRSTGGGAIVHDHELTYSFLTPISQRFSADHQQLVRIFHETLCESLASWKIVANLYRLTPSESPQNRQPSGKSFLCFERRATDDVVLGDVMSGGPKIAGTAQRRRRNSLLQHGSVLLAKSMYAPELLGVGDFFERPPNVDELIDVWSRKIADRLGVKLVRGEVTHGERQSAEGHRIKRYEASAWQERR
jgi:lipoate-protein ligase A